MITGDHDKLKEIADNNLCAEHNSLLTVAWFDKAWVIRCDMDGGHFPDAVTGKKSISQEVKQGGEPVPGAIDQVKSRTRKKQPAEANHLIDPSLALMPQLDLGTKALLTPDQVRGLVDFALKYDLDPYLGHVVLMYGKPYIGLDGYLYHANRTVESYSLGSRPLTEDERKTYLIGADDFAWTCDITVDDNKRAFTGLGIVTKAEMEETSKRDPAKLASPVVAAHPQLLCQKRAEWQACRRAFPLGADQEVKEE